MDKNDVLPACDRSFGPNYSRYLGEKRYELVNHLGNVLEVITDRRFQIQETATGFTHTVKYYEPDVVSMQDYDPFGMLLVGRNWAGGSGYRYGFNNKENDDEIAGNNNALDFGARIYDARLGKFLTIDPRYAEYPWQSTYSYFTNNLIVIVDINGEGGPKNASGACPSCRFDVLAEAGILNIENNSNAFLPPNRTATSISVDGRAVTTADNHYTYEIPELLYYFMQGPYHGNLIEQVKTTETVTAIHFDYPNSGDGSNQPYQARIVETTTTTTINFKYTTVVSISQTQDQTTDYYSTEISENGEVILTPYYYNQSSPTKELVNDEVVQTSSVQFTIQDVQKENIERQENFTNDIDGIYNDAVQNQTQEEIWNYDTKE